jgi:hypothetical protein
MLASAGSCRRAEWVAYESSDWGFRAVFPGQPVESPTALEGPQGILNVRLFQSPIEKSFGGGLRGSLFLVYCVGLPAGTDARAVASRLEALAASDLGGRIVRRQDPSPRTELVIKAGDTTYRTHVVVRADRVLAASVRRDWLWPRSDVTFLNGFEVAPLAPLWRSTTTE